jgi:integrase
MDDQSRFLNNFSFAGTTKESYAHVLKQLFSEIGDLERFTPDQFLVFINRPNWGNCYRWVAYNAVRQFVRWRYGENHPIMQVKIKRVDAGPQRVLTSKQVSRLIGAFDLSGPKGIRDLAMCALMLDSGLRISEICRLELRHVDLVDRNLSVIVKGGDWGEGVFSKDTANYIGKWLPVRDAWSAPGIKTLFVSVGGDTPGKQMTRGGLSHQISKWNNLAGVDRFSPHDLRRTFAVLSTRLGAPSRILQVAGRWKSLAMVERYTASITSADFEPYFPVSANNRRF